MGLHVADHLGFGTLCNTLQVGHECLSVIHIRQQSQSFAQGSSSLGSCCGLAQGNDHTEGLREGIRSLSVPVVPVVM